MDLSLRSAAQAPEICIHRGGLTGFVFDQPASVDLEDEVRFGSVLRGRSSISFIPPPDLAPGERLRLTVHFEKDAPEQGVTFMLVAHPGQVTHQVDVFRDQRSRTSLWQELEEERARNQRLDEENQALHEQLKAPGGLLRLFLNGELNFGRIPTKEFGAGEVRSTGSALDMMDGVLFRSFHSVAVRLSIKNTGTEPWRVVKALLVANAGMPLEGLQLAPSQAILPGTVGSVFVEARAAAGAPLEGLTVTLSEEGPRSITVENLPAP